MRDRYIKRDIKRKMENMGKLERKIKCMENEKDTERDREINRYIYIYIKRETLI